MSICIVAATELELKYLPAKQYDTLVTGLGSAATTYHLLKKINHHKPSLFIQAGIAGSFDTSIPLGTPLLIQKDRFADLGAHENNQWKDVFDLGLEKENEKPFVQGWLENPHEQLLHTLPLQLVPAISINEVTTSAQRIQQLKEKYNPAVESMEGAAFHYTCLQENIPFIQLRTVSNYVGVRDKSQWQIEKAVKNLCGQLELLISKLAPAR